MNKLNKKEAGLYILSSGTFITEKEDHKEWSELIIEESSIASMEEFYELYGYDYDLDNAETYYDFLHLFDERITKSRKSALTINLDPTNLLHSKVTSPNMNDKIDLMDCDYEITSEILSGFDIQSSTTDLDVEGLEELNGELVAYYRLDNQAFIKTDVCNSTFTYEEYIDYLFERLEEKVSKPTIMKNLSEQDWSKPTIMKNLSE